MSQNIETKTTSSSIQAVGAKVDMDRTLGSAAYREASSTISSGKASVPTGDAVVSFLKSLVADSSDFDDFKAKIQSL